VRWQQVTESGKRTAVAEAANASSANGAYRSSRVMCPPWCATRHGVSLGEEDWVHVSEPLAVADDTLARLCMSIDPETGAVDGPYLIIGTREYTLPEAEALAGSLMDMVSLGAGVTPPSVAGRRSRGPSL
jgi:hypothetical protein